jgi:hypothetical protein
VSNIVSLSKIRKARDKAATPPRPDALSFVSKRKAKGGSFNYWAVKPAGSYSADYAAGAVLAEEYLRFIGAHPTYGNGTLLTCIVHDMIEQAKDGGPWSGLHAGFLTGVNRHAMAAARMMGTA